AHGVREARQRRERSGIDVASGNGIGHLADVPRGRSDAGGEQCDGDDAGQSDTHAVLLENQWLGPSATLYTPSTGRSSRGAIGSRSCPNRITALEQRREVAQLR